MLQNFNNQYQLLKDIMAYCQEKLDKKMLFHKIISDVSNEYEISTKLATEIVTIIDKPEDSYEHLYFYRTYIILFYKIKDGLTLYQARKETHCPQYMVNMFEFLLDGDEFYVTI